MRFGLTSICVVRSGWIDRGPDTLRQLCALVAICVLVAFMRILPEVREYRLGHF